MCMTKTFRMSDLCCRRAAGQGPRASDAPMPMDSQASVHQASQGMTDVDDAAGISLVPADRSVCLHTLGYKPGLLLGMESFVMMRNSVVLSFLVFLNI